MTFSIFSCFLRSQPDAFHPPQSRHPERSAARIHRITDGLWRVVEGPRRCLCWQMLFPAFQPQTTGQIKKVTSSERSQGICSFPPPTTKAEGTSTLNHKTKLSSRPKRSVAEGPVVLFTSNRFQRKHRPTLLSSRELVTFCLACSLWLESSEEHLSTQASPGSFDSAP